MFTVGSINSSMKQNIILCAIIYAQFYLCCVHNKLRKSSGGKNGYGDGFNIHAHAFQQSQNLFFRWPSRVNLRHCSNVNKYEDRLSISRSLQSGNKLASMYAKNGKCSFDRDEIETKIRSYLTGISSFASTRREKYSISTSSPKVSPLKYSYAWRKDYVLSLFHPDVKYVDTAYYRPVLGTENLIRHLGLFDDEFIGLDKPSDYEFTRRVMDDMAIEFEMDSARACVLYHRETLPSGGVLPDSRGIIFFRFDSDGLITSIFDVVEPNSPKPGDSGLKILKLTSNLFNSASDEKNMKRNFDEQSRSNLDRSKSSDKTSVAHSENVVQRYFGAWNKRDMQSAVECFDYQCQYADLQYPNAFEGKASLAKHLDRVAECLAPSFAFVIDDLAVDNEGDEEKIGVVWHVENNKEEMPFSRGCSFYTIIKKEKSEDNGNLIRSAVDIPEPAVIKTGSWQANIRQTLKAEPIRLVPLTVWLIYNYVVFFSDGILPGANALALEARTWEEVRDLSINFFLVAPIFHLSFSPVVHPMLEGVFNFLLAWAAMFAGFLSDERQDKPNLLDMRPMVLGMQFLTSAFLLPYLVVRTSEPYDINSSTNVVFQDKYLTNEGTMLSISEWKPLGGFLAIVGAISAGWALFARPEFGTSFAERYESFINLLSVDRVGSSFLVDLFIFALFQGWLVDDDLRRRGTNVSELIHVSDFHESSEIQNNQLRNLRIVAKFIPFFGMAAYLMFRPSLPNSSEKL